MEWWIQTIALVAMIPASLGLVDWFISRSKNLAMRSRITDLWVKLAIFSYSEAVRKSLVYCNDLFDRIYGQRHFTWRCFLPSSAMSILATLSLILLFSSLSHVQLLDVISDMGVVVLFALLINVWADYFSLVETRWILRYTEKVQLRSLSVLLILDIVCTATIYIVTLWLCVFLPVAAAGLRVNFLGAPQFFWSNFTDPLHNPGAAALIWSTFTTSILFYLYCLLALGLKCLGLSKTPLMTFLQNLQEKDRFLTSVGLFLAPIIFIITIISKFTRGGS
jgi:hypothetical protein